MVKKLTIPVTVPEPPKKLRGLALLKQRDPERFKQIASSGGRRAHESGNAHQFDSAEGRAAARKRVANMAKKS